MSEKRIDFIGRLDGRTELGDGSVRYNARLTRVGVFDYGDHKELRLPEEVFAQKALDSFKGLVVTDGHRAWVDADSWKELAIGHVGDDVRQADDGIHVDASVILKDRAAITRADSGDLAEISMGYGVDLEPTSGQTADGEKYDSIQRNISGNHAALGPLDWGRAGNTVRLLDGAAYGRDMTTPAQRIDAPAANTDAADLAAARADNDVIRKERDAARKDAADAAKRADTAEAERDNAKKDLEKAKTEAGKLDSLVDARVNLIVAARGILGADFKPTKTVDGKDSPMSDREIRVAALTKVDPAAKFDGKSDDYVAARFDLAGETVKTDRAALGELNEVTSLPVVNADVNESEIDKAKRESLERTANAWKPKAKK